MSSAYPIASFFLFFYGYTSFVSTVSPFSIIYFLLTTVSTVGYGDVVLTDTKGRVMTIVFIVVSAFYLPNAIFTLYKKFTEALPLIRFKTNVSGGIILIGEHDSSLVDMGRQIVPDELKMSFIVVQPNVPKLI